VANLGVTKICIVRDSEEFWTVRVKTGGVVIFGPMRVAHAALEQHINKLMRRFRVDRDAVVDESERLTRDR